MRTAKLWRQCVLLPDLFVFVTFRSIFIQGGRYAYENREEIQEKGTFAYQNREAISEVLTYFHKRNFLKFISSPFQMHSAYNSNDPNLMASSAYTHQNVIREYSELESRRGERGGSARSLSSDRPYLPPPPPSSSLPAPSSSSTSRPYSFPQPATSATSSSSVPYCSQQSTPYSSQQSLPTSGKCTCC